MPSNILEVRNLSKHFGGLQAVSGLSFEVREGEIMALIGPNGAGKTTTFNVISGRYKPDSGEIRFQGQNIARQRPDRICKLGVCRTFQLAQPFGQMTVLENAMIGAFCQTADRATCVEMAARQLEFAGLYSRRSDQARNLTTIDQRRLEVARALATGPKLLLLDETMAGLTPLEVDVAIELIRKVRESGITVVVVEHVMRAIMNVSERIVVLDGGIKIAEGRPQEICTNEAVIMAYLGERYRNAAP